MMNKEDSTTTSIDILGKTYQIKCPLQDVNSLQKAALYLEDKMRELRDTGKVLSADRIAVITALNIAHQFLNLESQSKAQLQAVQQRLNDIHNRMNVSLSSHQEAESIFAE